MRDDGTTIDAAGGSGYSTAAMIQQLPLNDHHRASGASLKFWHERIVPERFTATKDEHQAVRERAGLIDWSTTGILRVTGADRAAFLHNLLTNDIKSLAPGAGCHAALLNASGKLLADLLVLAGAEEHWLLVDNLYAAGALDALQRYRITEAVMLANDSARFAILAVQGPDSIRILRQVLDLPLAVLQPLDHHQAMVGAAPVRFVAHRITNYPGMLMIVPVADAAALWDAIVQRGQPKGLRPVGWDAFNMLRLEAGLPWYGIDIDDSNLLPETGLEETAVSGTKGCYVGQEIVARMATYGSASRKLMGLTLAGTKIPDAKSVIVRGAEEVGSVTSACWSPVLQKAIALASLKRPFYEIGLDVEIAHRDGRIPATVVKWPFVTVR